jgi:hypothetical protein
MNKILIAAGSLAIVGGSAGAGYYVMSTPVEATVEDSAQQAYADPVKDPRYIDIDPLVIPVIADGRIRHHVFIKLSLEVDGKETANRVLAMKIRLHHAFYMALYDGSVQSEDGSGLDTEKIKAIVRREAAGVMGGSIVEAVAIRQAVPGQT